MFRITRKLLRMLCHLSCKKALLLLSGGFLFTLFSTYLLMFNHGEPEDIMESNKLNYPNERRLNKKDMDHLDGLEKELMEEDLKATEFWDKFIKQHDYVSIGEIYDNCDENDRMMIGRTIMLPTRHIGGIKGVKSRTFVNITLDEELDGGKFFIEVKYNGKDLFSRNWELCTLDEDYGDERIIYCPFEPGEYSFVKDRPIPFYLPKGRYQTKGWVTDQQDQIVACGFSDFTL